jgi:hypothetical protein
VSRSLRGIRVNVSRRPQLNGGRLGERLPAALARPVTYPSAS